MWRVQATSILTTFDVVDQFIVEFLSWSVLHKGKTRAELENEMSRMNGNLGLLAKRITKIRSLLIDFASCLEVEQIMQAYLWSTSHYMELLDTGVGAAELSPTVMKLVKEAFGYFDRSLLDHKQFWDVYKPEVGSFNKDMYRQKAGELHQVCPYCDMIVIAHEGQSNIDHFLPKSKYPLLSVYGPNLVVSCRACNQSLKGVRSYLPIFHPYYHQAADHFRFTFRWGKIQVKTVITSELLDQQKAHNFCELMRIEDIYAKQRGVVESNKLEIQRTAKRRYVQETSFVKENSIETPIGRLERILREELDDRIELVTEAVGKIPFCKLLIDLYTSMKSPSNLETHVFLLACDLGISNMILERV